MITGVKEQYPKATQSVLQKLNMKKKSLPVKKIIHKKFIKYL